MSWRIVIALMFASAAMAQEDTNLAIKDAEGVSENDREGKCEYLACDEADILNIELNYFHNIRSITFIQQEECHRRQLKLPFVDTFNNVSLPQFSACSRSSSSRTGCAPRARATPAPATPRPSAQPPGAPPAGPAPPPSESAACVSVFWSQKYLRSCKKYFIFSCGQHVRLDR